VQTEKGERELVIWDDCVSGHDDKSMGNWVEIERLGAIMPIVGGNVPCQHPIM
jgi:hypothetical protein